MICPGCHYMDDRMPNCLVCGGRGVLEDESSADLAALRDQQIGAREGAEGAKEEKADTDCTDSTDEKQEVKVKTFAERLEGLKAVLVPKIERGDWGVAECARATFKNEAELIAERMPWEPEEMVTRLLIRALVLLWAGHPHVSHGRLIQPNAVVFELNVVLQLLMVKNASYGDTALNPQRYFATGSALEMIYTRADDKLNRIFTAANAFGEDALKDLAGYLVLALLALETEKQWDDGVRAGTYCPAHRLPWNRCGCQP